MALYLLNKLVPGITLLVFSNIVLNLTFAFILFCIYFLIHTVISRSPNLNINILYHSSHALL